MANERLISRVKLLAFTATISTNTRARVRSRGPLKMAYRFLYARIPFSHPFDRAREATSGTIIIFIVILRCRRGRADLPSTLLTTQLLYI